MVDNIDAVNPANIPAEWDGQIVVPVTVLANPDAFLFDSEAGNAGVDAVAAAVRKRFNAHSWAGIYVNEEILPAQTVALQSVMLDWKPQQVWPAPGVYMWAAHPDGPVGEIPGWCPIDPIMVQDRAQDIYDLSTVFGAYPGRVAGYIDGPISRWPAGAWSRFVLYRDDLPKPPPPPSPAPPANPGGVVTVNLPELTQGRSGEPVRSLQMLLNGRGAFPRLAQDGIFGPVTEGAVRDYQHAAGLVVDGVVGPHTWGALLGSPQ